MKRIFILLIIFTYISLLQAEETSQMTNKEFAEYISLFLPEGEKDAYVAQEAFKRGYESYKIGDYETSSTLFLYGQDIFRQLTGRDDPIAAFYQNLAFSNEVIFVDHGEYKKYVNDSWEMFKARLDMIKNNSPEIYSEKARKVIDDLGFHGDIGELTPEFHFILNTMQDIRYTYSLIPQQSKRELTEAQHVCDRIFYEKYSSLPINNGLSQENLYKIHDELCPFSSDK